jgi:hypothetical protein
MQHRFYNLLAIAVLEASPKLITEDSRDATPLETVCFDFYAGNIRSVNCDAEVASDSGG